jgi:HEAT repeat protein
VRALGQLESAPALPHLLTALEDRDAWVRYFAARSVGQHRYPEALDAIVQLAQADPAGHVRIAALEALGQIGGARAVAPLTPWAQAADLDIARAALGALATIDHPDALPPLLAALQAPEQTRRIDALQALAKRGGADVVEPLQRAAAHADPQIAQAAIEALTQSASDAAIGALVGLAADAAHRDACIVALARLGEKHIDMITRGLAQPVPSVRSAVVEALARMKLPRASEFVRGALDDPDPAVRLAAARALGQLGSRHAERQLSVLAHSDADLAVRRAAHAALRQ